MSDGYKHFGARVAIEKDPTIAVGRYACQREAERMIAREVTSKLAISPNDSLLEIGCGVGALLIPLSFQVDEAWGVDHPAMVSRLKERCELSNGHLIGGDFLSLIKGDAVLRGRSFDKVLIYSVLHCLPDESTYLKFIDAAVALLAPGGRILLGDLPNKDLKKRFSESEAGKRFQVDWDAKRNLEGDEERLASVPDFGTTLEFGDKLILNTIGRLRACGLDAYVAPQSPDLPFGHTREDIWAIKN